MTSSSSIIHHTSYSIYYLHVHSLFFSYVYTVFRVQYTHGDFDGYDNGDGDGDDDDDVQCSRATNYKLQTERIKSTDIYSWLRAKLTTIYNTNEAIMLSLSASTYKVQSIHMYDV